MSINKLIIFFVVIVIHQTILFPQDKDIKLGADILFEKYFHLIQHKKVGIICNHTSLLANGTHIVDTIIKRGIEVTALFTPEHGIRGTVPAGIKIKNSFDERTGLKIYSLYGNTKKPTLDMLKDVEVFLFDIQDVGARFYTYNITMGNVIKAAYENNKRLIILDRPNPINGIDIEGPVLDTTLKSDVGMFPIPIRHGLTLGEMAKMAIGENWLGENINTDIIIIPIENWTRELYYDETELEWISPSPNIKTVSTAVVYPGTCLIEGTNVSEGRGTPKPFEYIGAPWIEGNKLADRLNALKLNGVIFESIEFIPKSDSIAAINPKYENQLCSGIYVNVTDRSMFEPVKTGLAIISKIYELYPKKFSFKENFFDKLAGDKTIRKNIIQKKEEVQKNFIDSLNMINYVKKREKYLLY